MSDELGRTRTLAEVYSANETRYLSRREEKHAKPGRIVISQEEMQTRDLPNYTSRAVMQLLSVRVSS